MHHNKLTVLHISYTWIHVHDHILRIKVNKLCMYKFLNLHNFLNQSKWNSKFSRMYLRIRRMKTALQNIKHTFQCLRAVPLHVHSWKEPRALEVLCSVRVLKTYSTLHVLRRINSKIFAEKETVNVNFRAKSYTWIRYTKSYYFT